MPKHRTFYWVTDEEARALELASLAMKYAGFAAVEQALVRLVEAGTRPTVSQTLQASRPTSKPTKPSPIPTEHTGPWLPTPARHTPNAPQD